MEDVSIWASIAASVSTVAALLVAAHQLRLIARERTSASRSALYSHWLTFDVLLVENPRFYDLLYGMSNEVKTGTSLTSEEAALAEYRLDIAELLWIEGRARGYPVDSKYWDRTLGIPLLQRALRLESTWSSVREDYGRELRREAVRRGLDVWKPGLTGAVTEHAVPRS